MNDKKEDSSANREAIGMEEAGMIDHETLFKKLSTCEEGLRTQRRKRDLNRWDQMRLLKRK